MNKFKIKHPSTSENGFAPIVLVLAAVVVLIIFLIVSSTLPFKNGLLSSLFPKQSSHAAGIVDLSLVPTSVTVKQNDTFLVDVAIDAKTSQPSAMDLEINYDPAVLQMTALEPGFFFSKVLVPAAITSGKGTITLAQDIGAFKSGTGSVATLSFKALQNTTTASQVIINPTNTQIAAIGQTGNVVGNISNSSVTVSQLAAINRSAQFDLSAPATQAVGQEFAVQVRAKTATDMANLFVSKINFDPSKLAVSRIDTTGSFITQWVNNNSFDNTNGKISLIGGVPTPGYQATNLTNMATVYFTGKIAGTALIVFDASSSIYRNSDNQNILGTLTGSSITLSGVAPSPSPSVTPSASPAVSPSPVASASPTTSAQPSTNPSPAVTNPPSSNPSPTPSASPVATCTITQANWVPATNPINSGKVVSLNIKGTGTCAGKSVSVTVWEDDGILGSDPTTNNPPTVKFDANGNANTSWLAEFQQDGFNGINNPPEYYFNATLDGTIQVRSADPLLVVNQSTGAQWTKGDANRDGKVDYTDLSIMMSNWNKTTGFNDELDYNDDKVINAFDFAGLVQLLILAGLAS